MAANGRLYSFILLLQCFINVFSYNPKYHPCCMEPKENLTLAMIIDAFEIYGHDPTDKLDHLGHYQLQMMKIKRAPDQYMINEHVHIAVDHLSRFINLHVKELKDFANSASIDLEDAKGLPKLIDVGSAKADSKQHKQVLLIALDDVVDNMLTMYDNHNNIKNERIASYNVHTDGAVPMEFYISQEFYCGLNVYIFLSELYSDIYNMGRGIAPYCKDRTFHFLGFVHHLGDNKYFLEDDPSMSFPTDNFIQGLECHMHLCVYRFPFKKSLQHERDVVMLPKALVKCGTEVYKLPPLTAASCIITSGSFILDFNIQGIRFRHYDYTLLLPNGQLFYTKEQQTPLFCDHHVCEWNYTNFYGGPFSIPGDPGSGLTKPVPPFIEQTTTPPSERSTPSNAAFDNFTYSLDGCWFMFPPNYGSIAGISYLDPLPINGYRFQCQGAGNKGLYWYPQWMGAPPHHPYSKAGDGILHDDILGDAYYPHQNTDPVSVPRVD